MLNPLDIERTQAESSKIIMYNIVRHLCLETNKCKVLCKSLRVMEMTYNWRVVFSIEKKLILKHHRSLVYFYALFINVRKYYQQRSIYMYSNLIAWIISIFFFAPDIQCIINIGIFK